MRPNILLIVVDCLRANTILEQDKTSHAPSIDALRENGVTFLTAISSATTTLPSFGSLLTGRYPAGSGVRSHVGARLRHDVTPLAERLAEAGYFTRSEVTGPLLGVTGLSRGFKSYNCRPASQTVLSRWGEDLLDSIQSMPEPWFLLLHLFELHAPRRVSPELNSKEFGRTHYERALSSVDRYIGKLLDSGHKDTCVVLTADHGELTPKSRLGEFVLSTRPIQTFTHRFLTRWVHHRPPPFYIGHGVMPVDDLVHVPLVLAAPDIPSGLAFQAQVRHVDIAPTLATLANVEMDDDLDGQDLQTIIAGTEKGDRLAIAEIGKVVFEELGWSILVRNPPARLYGFPYDHPPREIVKFDSPLSSEVEASILLPLRAALSNYVRRSEATPEPEAYSEAEENELRKRLEDLGYL